MISTTEGTSEVDVPLGALWESEVDPLCDEGRKNDLSP